MRAHREVAEKLRCFLGLHAHTELATHSQTHVEDAAAAYSSIKVDNVVVATNVTSDSTDVGTAVTGGELDVASEDMVRHSASSSSDEGFEKIEESDLMGDNLHNSGP